MILITGGAGYIGSHLALELLTAQKEILIFDNLETGHIETINVLKDKYLKFVQGDLRNKNDIENLFKNNEIESVVHFAAYSLVGESVKNPFKYWDNNLLGGLNLLNAMAKYGVNKIVFSSTAATYGEPKYCPIDENHPQKPINAYGNTKLAIENMLDDYDRTFGIKSVKLRYFNAAGADFKSKIGEWHIVETHLIPNIIRSALSSGKVFEIYGNDYDTPDGSCVRDYINVADLADAHIKALEYLNKGGGSNVFNLGTNSGNSVLEVFDCASEIIGKKIEYKIMGRRPGDPAILVANNKKAKEILGWSPSYSLSDSISTAFEWEKARIKKYGA